jgi:hypothetical protein
VKDEEEDLDFADLPELPKKRVEVERKEEKEFEEDDLSVRDWKPVSYPLVETDV